ncbi:MAG: glycerol-3-phosphate 1-O-acyltransferase PlsY [Planctomycetota bacterium]
MDQYLIAAGSLMAAYLVGGVPFGFIAGKQLRGIDIREHGSGNLGATNVARVLGWKVGIAVLLLDALKGFVPTFFLVGVSQYLGGVPEGFAPWFQPVIALSAIGGHNWPIYLGFRGGKGVATSLGALLALDPAIVAIGFAVFLAAILVTKMISVGSVLAAFAVAVATWLTTFTENDLQTDIFITVLAVLVVIRHRGNVKRILAGTEPRFTDKVKPAQTETPATENGMEG